MKTPVNKHEIRVIGMSRSGNHCLINWIMAQAEGRICFLNCAEGKTNPFHSARPLETGRSYRVNYAGFDLAAERRGAFSAKDYLIHSYEDAFLGGVCGGAFEADHDRHVGASARRLDVLVLRDPFNLFASRRRMGFDDRATVAGRIWKQHAREFLGAGRHLTRAGLPVSYNEWVGSRAYRRRLAERLGLAFTDAGIDSVPRCAGGSSFDGVAFDGRARQMAVFERWRSAADDPRYRALFDPEMVRLAERIFGAMPGAGRLLAA